MKQTQRLALDRKIDSPFRALPMRVRPKVILATSYEEALAYAEQFKDYLLCMISDRKFPKGGVLDREAGIKLIKAIKEWNPDLPTLLQSSDPDKEAWATALNSCFINKNSCTLGTELSSFFYQYLGFGDFVFRDKSGQEIARAVNMDDLKEKLRTVPVESIIYHASRDHFSAWLMARGEVQVAQVVLKVKVQDFEDPEDLRPSSSTWGTSSRP